MAEEREITADELATFRRCTFARRVFASYPTLRAKTPMHSDDLPPDSRGDGEGDGEWHMSKPYQGEPFDPEEYELQDGGWDHEHCDLCWTKVEDGMSYWPNVDRDAGHVDLCESCYPRVLALLSVPPDA
jgi:hypothetical protein